MPTVYLRNVQMRRHKRYCSASHASAEPHEHGQSCLPGVTEPERSRGNREGTGEEVGRCEEGLLCWKRVRCKYLASGMTMGRGSVSKL